MKNKILEFRHKNGRITQEYLAKQVGCSRQSIHAVETGKFCPSIILALKIARFFNTRVENIFKLDKDENN
jgi:putative transcriptional regulator